MRGLTGPAFFKETDNALRLMAVLYLQELSHDIRGHTQPLIYVD